MKIEQVVLKKKMDKIKKTKNFKNIWWNLLKFKELTMGLVCVKTKLSSNYIMSKT